jgi:adenosylhomocysteine nucleosidase
LNDRIVGIVAALDAEARAFGPAARRRGGVLADGTLLTVSGMGAELAAPAACRLIEAGASALLSFGFAGGLDPKLRAGSVVLPS